MTEAVEAGAETGAIEGLAQDHRVTDPLAALESSRANALARYAVPTLVALVDARPGRQLVVTDERSLADGGELAALFDRYYEVVASAERFDQLYEEELAYTPAPHLLETMAVLGELHVRVPSSTEDIAAASATQRGEHSVTESEAR